MLSLLQKSLQKEKLPPQKKSCLIVAINWSKQFSIEYVRQVSVIKRHADGIHGHIAVGLYISSTQLHSPSNYKDGDLFVICEQTASHHFIYHLVQVNGNTHAGYTVLERVPRSHSFPFHENLLVSTILKSESLVKKVEVLPSTI